MATPPGLTKDGYEIQFGTNHVGHALLIKLLLPTMIETAKLPGADVRVISLSSEGAAGHPSGGIIFKDLKTTQSNLRILGPVSYSFSLYLICLLDSSFRQAPHFHLCM